MMGLRQVFEYSLESIFAIIYFIDTIRLHHDTTDNHRKEFVRMRGFSQKNLWNMRNFYIEYKDKEELQSLTKLSVKDEYNFSFLEFGIIIRKEKNRTIVEYALKENTQEIENNLMHFLEERNEK